MCEIIGFPISKVSEVVRRRMSEEPCNVIILPVVRVERPEEWFPVVNMWKTTTKIDLPLPKRRGRQSRRLVMERLRELQLELGRSL